MMTSFYNFHMVFFSLKTTGLVSRPVLAQSKVWIKVSKFPHLIWCNPPENRTTSVADQRTCSRTASCKTPECTQGSFHFQNVSFLRMTVVAASPFLAVFKHQKERNMPYHRLTLFSRPTKHWRAKNGLQEANKSFKTRIKSDEKTLWETTLLQLG